MSQAPVMPLYVDALVSDTTHLSADEFGAYCLLLFATWRNNGRPLPDDDNKLARVCRVSLARWRKSMRSKLVGFFRVDDVGWHQKRLEKEWNYVQEKRESLKKNGSRGRDAKALKKTKPGLANASANASASLNQIQNLDIIYNNSSPPRAYARDPAAGAASGAPAPPSEPEVAEVERLVQSAASTLGMKRAVTPPAPSKRDAWLNNLSAWVGTAEQLDFQDRMVAWQMIEDCRIAGCRARTPPHIRTALDRISKLRLLERAA